MFNFLKRQKTYNSELRELDKRFPYKENKEYKELKIELEYKYKMIDEYTKSHRLIEIEFSDNEKEKQLKLLELDKEYKKVDGMEYEKRFNDINQNPWAKIHFNYDEKTDPTNMQTEVIYNEYFIKKLQDMGYSGESEDDIIESWLSQVFASNISSSDLGFGEDDNTSDTNYVKKTKIDNKMIIG